MIGRLYLQLGDLKSAQTYFSQVVKSCDSQQDKEDEQKQQHKAIIKINEYVIWRWPLSSIGDPSLSPSLSLSLSLSLSPLLSHSAEGW